MINEFLTILNNKLIIEEKKSKFISESFPVSNLADIKEILDKVRNESKDATHHVYAYVLLNGLSKSCDDKEPAGTAGIQVLNAINSFGLKNTLIVITRYFGGIKLGKGGLSRTYFYCAKTLIEKSEIIKKKLCYKVILPLTYREYNIIKDKVDFNIIDVQFNNDVKVKFAVEVNKIDEFQYAIKKLTKIEENFDISEYEYI